MKYTLPKDAAALSTLIKSAITSATTMRSKVQLAAVGILHHAYQCGDWTKANELVEGLGHGVKRDSLVEYFVVNGGLVIAEGAKEFTGWKGKEFIKENFETAKDKMWFEYRKANPFKGYEGQAEFDKFIKKLAAMSKLKEQGVDDADKINLDLNVSEYALKVMQGALDISSLIITEEPANDTIAALEGVVAADQAASA